MLKKILFIFLIIISLISSSQSKDNVYILLTINGEIITNYDVNKEGDYLQILNPNLRQLKKDKIFQIARDSLVREIIKKNEIKKIFDLKKKNPHVDDYFKNLYTRLNFDNQNDFKDFLITSSDYSVEEVKEKLKIEIMWNQLIHFKYSDQVNINKEKLLKKINVLENQTMKEYLLFEIVFKKKKGQNFKSLIENINISILENGFENTANIFSISDSSKFGGKVGWVNENNLSEVISSELKNIKEGEITNLINIGNNFLILKVEKIRESEISINKEEELNKMINFETNKQLNQFSKIFFDKSKINYSINEK